MTPGFHMMRAETYHADPAPQPSLSSSIAQVLLRESPYKAWFSHPRLNPNYREEHDAKFDIGTAAHSLLLEGDDCMVVCDFADWRSKAAREQRVAARLEGKVPVLTHQAEGVRAMVGAARAFISASEIAEYWGDARSEIVAVWQERGAWLRCRFDRLAKNHRCIIDYKTSDSAAPEVFQRQIARMSYDVQHAFYRRAIRAQGAADPQFVFLCQSCQAPYECSLHGLDPACIEIADAKVERAVGLWRTCITTNRWPSYDGRIHYLMPTAWQLAEHELNVAAEEEAA